VPSATQSATMLDLPSCFMIDRPLLSGGRLVAIAPGRYR
jgi:hypothetical protein